MAGRDRLREQILQVLNPARVLAFYQAEGLREISAPSTDADGKDQYQALCPFPHENGMDSSPSFSFTTFGTGGWLCFACGLPGDMFTFYQRRHNVSYIDASTAIAQWLGMEVKEGARGRVAPPPLTAELVQGWATRLQSDSNLLGELYRLRGVERDTLARYEIGWDGERITIPVKAEDGAYINIRRYSLSTRGQAKMINYGGMGNSALYPIQHLRENSTILLCEGEWDALLSQQILDKAGTGPIGAVMTWTNGVGNFETAWGPLFRDKVVYICTDNDEAGRDGARKVAQILSKFATIYIVSLPKFVGDKGDLTDYFKEHERTWDDLLFLIQEAQLIPTQAPVAEDEEGIEAVNTTLAAAANASNMGIKLRFKGFVSGKNSEPYVLPQVLSMACTGDAQQCPICPHQGIHHTEKMLTARERGTLLMVNTPDAAQAKAKKQILGIPERCGRSTIDQPASQNMEELRLITDLEAVGQGAEQESVVRRAYVRTHGITANRAYYFQGYTWPDPKDQHVVHLVDMVEPAEDAIQGFTITPERADALRLEFAVRPGESPIDAAGRRALQMAWHNHHIHGRPNLQLFYDLTFHSVASFNLGRRFIRKGWCECIVVGDSGTGKSTMLEGMLRHYRVGEKITGENVTLAGILGGLSKMGDQWVLTWGKIPQNDRRLLAIDECGDMSPEILPALSDMRSSGIAEINKIVVEKTPARCRLIFMGNPRDGKSLINFTTPVEALRTLIGKNEDARRMDYAMAVRSNEIPQSVLEEAGLTPPFPLTATSDLCRDLVLWAWSRTTEQIKITKDAQLEINMVAREFGKKYHSSFPLVESSDQRSKIARMACALAALTFHTPDNETLVVTEVHVRCVSEFLHKLYEALGYASYSAQMAAINDMEEGRFGVLVSDLSATFNWELVVQVLSSTAETFSKRDLQEMSGLNGDQSDVLIRKLSLNSLIRRGRWGYEKNPSLTALLNKELVRIGAKGGPSASMATQDDLVMSGRPDF